MQNNWQLFYKVAVVIVDQGMVAIYSLNIQAVPVKSDSNTLRSLHTTQFTRSMLGRNKKLSNVSTIRLY